MAIALFNDQETLAGQKLGISSGKAIALMVMALGLASMNVYHMGNALTSKLLTPESSVFSFVLLYAIATTIAFMEIPVTEEIATQRAKGDSAIAHRVLLAVIVSMAVGAGLYSITTDADKRATGVRSHETAGQSFDDLKQALISDRNIARANAETASERSKANADYYRALAELRLQQSAHQSTRPALAVKTDSIFHWLWAIGFSLLCSLGVVAITNYLTKYHKPLTEIPRVFFRTKENQEWTMNDDDVRVIPATVDLSGGSSTGAARKKIAPSSDTKPEVSNNYSSGSIKNRPHVEDTRLGAVSNDSKSVGGRPPISEPEKGGKVEYSQGHYERIKTCIILG